MNHQPFEDWIFEEELSNDQLSQLKAHLSICEDCHRLHTAMKGLTRVLNEPVELSPRAGFSQRWEALAENRKENEENLTAWIVLGALILVAGSIVMANFGRLWFADLNFLQLTVTSLVNFVNLSTRFIQAIAAARTVIHVIPGNFIMVMTTAGGMLAFFWVSVWFAAMKRISSVQRRVK